MRPVISVNGMLPVEARRTALESRYPSWPGWTLAEALDAAEGAIGVSAACVGFLSALALAVGTLEAGRAQRALVIGADALSRYLDPGDRGSAMLFGDGAGAAVLSAVDGPRASARSCSGPIPPAARSSGWPATSR